MNRKKGTSTILGVKDLLLIATLLLVIIAICVLDIQLTAVFLFLLLVVLPGSLFLYWLDFRKQNKD